MKEGNNIVCLCIAGDCQQLLVHMPLVRSDKTVRTTVTVTFVKHKKTELRFYLTLANTGPTECPLTLIIKVSTVSFTNRASVY